MFGATDFDALTEKIGTASERNPRGIPPNIGPDHAARYKLNFFLLTKNLNKSNFVLI